MPATARCDAEAMDEYFFPTSPAAHQTATAGHPTSPDFPSSPPADAGTPPFASALPSPFELRRGGSPDLLRLDARLQILTERLNFLDPELESASNRIEILEVLSHGNADRIQAALDGLSDLKQAAILGGGARGAAAAGGRRAAGARTPPSPQMDDDDAGVVDENLTGPQKGHYRQANKNTQRNLDSLSACVKT